MFLANTDYQPAFNGLQNVSNTEKSKSLLDINRLKKKNLLFHSLKSIVGIRKATPLNIKDLFENTMACPTLELTVVISFSRFYSSRQSSLIESTPLFIYYLATAICK